MTGVWNRRGALISGQKLILFIRAMYELASPVRQMAGPDRLKPSNDRR